MVVKPYCLGLIYYNAQLIPVSAQEFKNIRKEKGNLSLEEIANDVIFGRDENGEIKQVIIAP